MQDSLNSFLRKRRDRSIAIILGVKERECDHQLSNLASAKMRKVIMDQINDFYDAAVDVMATLDTGEVVLNDDYLAKLDAIHDSIKRMEASNG